MKCFPVSVFIFVTLAALVSLTYTGKYIADCHYWHSCPANHGEYVCGDTGNCQQCPDNMFCKNQNPFNYESPDLYILGRNFFATGSFSTFLLELKGGISDKDGIPLFSSRGDDAWWIDQTQKVKVVPDSFSHIVAITPNGKVIAEGFTESIYYSLKFLDDWDKESEVEIKVGFYDAWRPESNKLYPCTKLNVQDFRIDPVVQRQHYAVSDIVCDRITVLEHYQSRGFR
ncbi:Uncharacterised protein [uncultured archaeon]|nr:Uncharacterised protein [uncultured archaeon]